MLLFEIKKVLSRSINKFALLILVGILMGVSYFAIVSVSYVNADGKAASGIAAARKLQQDKNQWAGLLTEDVFMKMLKMNKEIICSKEYRSVDNQEKDKAFARQQGFDDIRDMVSNAFSPFREYNYYRADTVSAAEVKSIYENRVLSLKSWLKSDEAKYMYSDKEKIFLIKQYEKMNIPLYYEYADGWKALIEFTPTIIMLFVLIMGFLVAGVFSNEFIWKTESIYFSTKLGRSKAVRSKIGAGLFLVTLIYWGSILIYSAIVLFALGADGGSCMIQTDMGWWRSFYNLTFFQTYLLTIFGGYLGSMFILTLSMLASARTRSTLVAVIIPFILIFLPSFLSEISILSKVVGVLPDKLLQMCQTIRYFNFLQVGDNIIGSVSILMILYPVCFILLLPILYGVYKRIEVK